MSKPIPRIFRRRRGGAPLLLALSVLPALTACDVPTELPRWNTLWVVPGAGTAVAASSFLPSSVAVTPDGEAFVLSMQGSSFSATLGELCPECSGAEGRTVPKPPFTGSLTGSISFPGEVAAFDLDSGRLGVEITNGFSFDPLRPSDTARGHLLVTVSSGSTTLARDSVPGEAVGLPPGSTLVRTLQLSPGEVSEPIAVEVTLVSPAGDPVEVDTRERLSVTATPMELQATEARVQIGTRSITAQQTDIDLEGVDATVSDRIRSGALLLDIENPWQVTGTLRLTLTSPEVTIEREVPLRSGASTERVELSQHEIRGLLGAGPVRLSLAGTASAPDGTVSLRPTQAISIESRFELVIGSTEE